jgi:hypothetical protein
MPLGAGARLLQPYEFEKPGGIADRYLPLKLRLRREQGNQVDQLAILDLPPSFASPEALLDDQCERHRIEEVRHEAANDHGRIKVVRMIFRDDGDRDMHHDPEYDGKEQCHERCFISATAEVRPHEGEQHAPGERKEEVNGCANDVG